MKLLSYSKNKLKAVCRPKSKNKKFNLPGESRTASLQVEGGQGFLGHKKD